MGELLVSGTVPPGKDRWLARHSHKSWFIIAPCFAHDGGCVIKPGSQNLTEEMSEHIHSGISS